MNSSSLSLLWPQDQYFVDPARLPDLMESCAQPFSATLADLALQGDLINYLPSLYLPLAAWIDKLFSSREGTLVVGLCGAQGSGKSTMTALLAKVLISGFGRTVASFSIDDIYKTRHCREQLAKKVHPLFITRGVPGTHDVDLGLDIIHRLSSMAAGDEYSIPVFDKAVDDRKPKSGWLPLNGRVNIILFEGWCVGALPEAEAELNSPINLLERKEDSNGQWRRAVNRALATEYRKLFDLINCLMLLKVSGMNKVFEWRRLQERKLAQQVSASANSRPDLKVMNDAEVDRFIMHYERTTRHILREMPARAEVIFELDDTHNANRVLINRRLG